MQIFNAIRLTIETCERKHLSFSSQQTYTHWIKRYGLFLKDRTLASQTTEQKMEAFLTMLAGTGISASNHNQAFSALLFFYREVLHQQLGAVDASAPDARPPFAIVPPWTKSASCWLR